MSENLSVNGSGGQQWNGIQASLSEMERRLGELQDQLDPARAQRPGQADVAPLVGALTAVPELAAAPDAGVGAGAVATIAPPLGVDLLAQQHAEAILAQARASAQDILGAARAQVALVKQQVEELLTVRETIRDSLRTAAADCERSLARLERGEVAPAPSHPMPGAPGGGPPLLAAPPEISVRPTVFQGAVTLKVGPLAEISHVDTLEIALLQVPGAEQVEVKEFAGNDAVAELRLFQPVRLVEELRRVLPFSFEVADGDASSLTLLVTESLAAGGSAARATFAPPISDERE